jgi:hypothetical protein
MKKLLLVLLVVTLASFLFVGCIPVTPPTEGEGEGEGEAEICPAVAVTSQVAIGGKTYIQGGKQTITVTFAVPTEPVSVYVGLDLKDSYNPFTDPGIEVVMYANADKTVYTGTTDFAEGVERDCDEAYIYVVTCDSCAPCKYPYIVDTVAPLARVEICIADCDCEGCELSFTSTKTTDPCDPDVLDCGDDCSGFASWSIDIYDADPFDDCCLVPCETPIASDSGVCPIDFTTACLGAPTVEELWVVVTLVDNVGNSTKMEAKIEFEPDTCDVIVLTEIGPNDCVDTPDFVVCSDAEPS